MSLFAYGMCVFGYFGSASCPDFLRTHWSSKQPAFSVYSIHQGDWNVIEHGQSKKRNHRKFNNLNIRWSIWSLRWLRSVDIFDVIWAKWSCWVWNLCVSVQNYENSNISLSCAHVTLWSSSICWKYSINGYRMYVRSKLCGLNTPQVVMYTFCTLYTVCHYIPFTFGI